ncbi:exodeoxyribonuclease VII large subunit [Microbacterium sp. EYE_5]|uniref:exodeoxyribonuclease VII large subunit n=1 Tax=unclassified Microbacterium TaxID=2609290 RepID=UPI0020031FD6|nr:MULTISPECIES: exodeoxyribonuclease VII large subunit [unclassified Microbacterium]MCK6081088.1 exodeoxyribonuclease VII large subunit [Microbacterium sp. EYE_382]MCK6086358.1 exodeoxyribonuclease VII large subunit [Microbacterium sp. EYE_384]MCK6124144.1 exodeoxyribonuclease VII large subunit [Microbacterium sp. EYE_80]MCK6127053.1 exodeoxyribonuclease VII large subunit [Microbacterium sp. EYE_79]MCK6142043.1 exodeoxyribonuclease VII large subunit [Microbacterium sp. EYE_39]
MTSFQTAPGATPPPDAVHPRDSSPDTPTSVSRLNDTIRDFVQKWGSVWVEGEITAWNLRGGHVFGRLKDAGGDGMLSFRMWSSTLQRTPDDLKVGDRVVACVKADYFVKTGDFTFTVSAMRHTGLGDQLERLERLRATLRAEGLFDPSRKKPIPFLPHAIGLITGERSDAEKDVHRNAELRWPHVRFRTINAAVQGDRCVPETIAALRTLDADPEVDVIIIARGGGDPQTLLGFSDERLLRAVAAASTPVVSAIGHENDHPLLDDVADLRASTPTDAAKRVVPDVSEQRALVQQLRSRARTRLTQRVAHDIANLDQLRSRPVLRDPEALLTGRAQEVWTLASRGREIVRRRWDAAARTTAELRASLRALSPGATLDRGYAIAHLPGGTIVRDAAQAGPGAEVVVTVARGSFAARSEGVLAESADPHPGTDAVADPN